MLTHIDLFSGIGGFALAAQWAGFRTEVFCEIDPFCQEVLRARFGAVADADGERRGLVRKQEGEHGNSLSEDSRLTSNAIREGLEKRESISKNDGPQLQTAERGPLLIPDICSFDGTRFRGTTLLTGGFPCQPFSVAGKRKGKADDRHLWPEMLRVIHKARPTWIIGENVAGIINMELEQVCSDLEAEGYEVQPLVIPACAVNAPHRRSRAWIIARNSQNPVISRNGGRGDGDSTRMRWPLQTQGPDCDAPDAEGHDKRAGLCKGGQGGEWRGRPSDLWDTPWLEVATRFCRVDDGLPAWIYAHRVQRLRVLGNAIVPQVAYEIIKAISEIERGIA